MGKIGMRIAAGILWVGTAALSGAGASLLVNHASTAHAQAGSFLHPVVRAKAFHLVNDANELVGTFELGPGGGGQVLLGTSPLATVKEDGQLVYWAAGVGKGWRQVRIQADFEAKQAVLEVLGEGSKPVWRAP